MPQLCERSGRLSSRATRIPLTALTALWDRCKPYALGLLMLAGAGPAASEGSRNLYPSGYTGSRANMDVSAPTSFYAGVVKRDMFVYVYAQAGEYILIGSRNIADNGDVRIYDPQNFGTRGSETIPGTVNFSCFTGPNAAQPGPHYFGGGRGGIADRAQELAGPNSADNTVTVTNGYAPCAYRAPSTGIYGVSFRGGASGGGPNGIVDPPALSNSTVSAWDVTVRASATSLTDLSGRMYTYAFTFFTGGNNRPVSSSLYYVTEDGFRYRQDLRGFDPNGYALYANTLGFLDSGQPLYKDLRGANATLEPITPAGTGIVAQGAQFPLFFSNIDPAGPNAAQVDLVLAALGVSVTPPNATLTGATFTGSVSGNTSVVNAGGTFSFNTTNTVTFQIVISRDGIDFDPANVLNRVITGLAPSGLNSAVWDGLDNSGNPFPVGSYDFRIFGRNGEVHFPMIDSEGNVNGGSTITRLNGPLSGRTIVYYDDRGYVTRNGTAVGTLNGFICGASPPTPPVPDHDLIGVDSNANVGGIYYRAWAGNGNANADCDAGQGFGDAKGLDLWTYVTSTSDKLDRRNHCGQQRR